MLSMCLRMSAGYSVCFESWLMVLSLSQTLIPSITTYSTQSHKYFVHYIILDVLASLSLCQGSFFVSK